MRGLRASAAPGQEEQQDVSSGVLRCEEDEERPLRIPLPDSPGLTCLWLVFTVRQG